MYEPRHRSLRVSNHRLSLDGSPHMLPRRVRARLGSFLPSVLLLAVHLSPAWLLVGTGCSAAGPTSSSLTAQVEPGEPVPDVLTLSSRVDRVVVVRLRSGTDLLDGLKLAVAKEGIRDAVILSGAGSLTSYRVHSVGNTTFPPQNVFFQGEGPYDLTAVTGYVIRARVHAHITFSDERKALAGHLEPGTRVFTFAVITIGVLEEGSDLNRADDWEWR